ncbi:MAG TPA: aromatic amino acid ammonia-lyase, partial [Cyclobacteriaceae bacterium]|nr:aromatic amino acid ammonia-lyase [Cyclobacteriaceae bacterium]
MIVIGNRRLKIQEFEKVLFEQATVALDSDAMRAVKQNHVFLESYAKDKVIYGINTGLGPMAQFKISEEDQQKLQYNLIRSHASGSGNYFSERMARATVLARLNSLMLAHSGIHPDAVELLKEFLNHKIVPVIYERGGVGASGDLVQLAHLALNLIGEGTLMEDGKPVAAKQIFEKHSLRPLPVYLREGLALMNGTSAMTGVGMVNVIQAKTILSFSILLSALTNELMKSFDDHFSFELNHVKQHKGQSEIASLMRTILQDSKLIRKRPEHLYHKKFDEAVFTDKVQEYYSLRCVPQILGPVYDTLFNAQHVLENELNSVNDNPIIDHHKENVYHGGNFHGDYVSLEMDKLKMVITKLSMLAERQLNYLMNDKLNQKLPPF